MIEIQNNWAIKYHTVVACLENPKAIGWSFAADAAAYRGNVLDDTILVHVECDGTYGGREKRVIHLLESAIDIIALPKVEILECCCCGCATKGRQWRNRDTSYGMCTQCANENTARYGEGSAELGLSGSHTYAMAGIRGIHFDVKEPR